MSSTRAVDASNQAVLPVLTSGTLPPLGWNASLRQVGPSVQTGRRPKGGSALAGCAESFNLAVSRTGAARFPPRHVMFRACEAPLTARACGTTAPDAAQCLWQY